jgi:hypothetical protein
MDRLPLGSVYWPLLDAWATEMSSAYAPRSKVVAHIEEQLDAARPQEERLKDWGKQMTPEQFAQLQKGRRG